MNFCGEICADNLLDSVIKDIMALLCSISVTSICIAVGSYRRFVSIDLSISQNVSKLATKQTTISLAVLYL